MKPDKENSTCLSDHAKLPETKCMYDISGNPCGIAQTLHDQWALVSNTTVFLPVNEEKFNY